MNREQFENLQINEKVFLISNPDLVLNVVEIATDAKSLQYWINRGYTEDIKRIIKLEGYITPDEFCYHTWICWPNNFNCGLVY